MLQTHPFQSVLFPANSQQNPLNLATPCFTSSKGVRIYSASGGHNVMPVTISCCFTHSQVPCVKISYVFENMFFYIYNIVQRIQEYELSLLLLNKGMHYFSFLE